MKITTSRALAVAGVSAAALITAAANTAALGSGTEGVSEPVALSQTSVSQAAASIPQGQIGVQDLDVVVVDSTTTTDGAMGSSAPATATTYRIGDAGVITVDTSGAGVEVTDLRPNVGWTAADPDDGSPDSVYALFSDGSIIVEFRAEYVDGALTPALNSMEAGS